MSHPDLGQLKRSLLDADIEVYRATDEEIHVAERIRLHLMDSGVRVRPSSEGVQILLTVRSQRSDFPNAALEQLFDKVREGPGAIAMGRGFTEADLRTVNVNDPMDADKLLDVWHEITFAKTVGSTVEAIDEVRWALGLEKYVTP